MMIALHKALILSIAITMIASTLIPASVFCISHSNSEFKVFHGMLESAESHSCEHSSMFPFHCDHNVSRCYDIPITSQAILTHKIVQKVLLTCEGTNVVTTQFPPLLSSLSSYQIFNLHFMSSLTQNLREKAFTVLTM